MVYCKTTDCFETTVLSMIIETLGCLYPARLHAKHSADHIYVNITFYVDLNEQCLQSKQTLI
jgi:hypothetical protein